MRKINGLHLSFYFWGQCLRQFHLKFMTSAVNEGGQTNKLNAQSLNELSAKRLDPVDQMCSHNVFLY